MSWIILDWDNKADLKLQIDLGKLQKKDKT